MVRFCIEEFKPKIHKTFINLFQDLMEISFIITSYCTRMRYETRKTRDMSCIFGYFHIPYNYINYK